MIDSSGRKVSDDTDREEKELLETLRFIEKFDDPDNYETKKAVGDACYSLARIYRKKSQSDKALSYAKRALEQYQARCSSERNSDNVWDLAFAYCMIRDIHRANLFVADERLLIEVAENSVASFREYVALSESSVGRTNLIISLLICGVLLKRYHRKNDALQKYKEALAVAEEWLGVEECLNSLDYTGYCSSRFFDFLEEENLYSSRDDNRLMEHAAMQEYTCYKKRAELDPYNEDAVACYAFGCNDERRFYSLYAEQKDQKKADEFMKEGNAVFFRRVLFNPVAGFSNFFLTGKMVADILEKNGASEEEYGAFFDRMERGCRKSIRFMRRCTAPDAPEPLSLEDEAKLRPVWAEGELWLAKKKKQWNHDTQAYLKRLSALTQDLDQRIPQLRQSGVARFMMLELDDVYLRAYEAIFDVSAKLITPEKRRLIREAVEPDLPQLSQRLKNIYDLLTYDGSSDDPIEDDYYY